MSHEIYYTSAPEGMKRGSSGFSTVGATDGISRALWDRLESLSAYRHHFGVAAAEGGGGNGPNPTSYAHWLLSVAGANYHVLSRVCDSGVDHTQRSNAFAHHLVLEASELASAGPAWLLEQPGVMRERWDGRVGTIARPERLPAGDIAGGICHAWAAATGDAGWGGVLADLFIKSPAKPVCVLFSPGQDLLPLLAETIALLPVNLRWNVTFNTYFTSMPTSATCTWRCCLAGTPASQTGLRYAANGVVIDLTDPARLGVIPEGLYVTFARTGIAPATTRAATPKAAAPARGGSIAVPVRSQPAPRIDEDEEEDGEYEFQPDPIDPVDLAVNDPDEMPGELRELIQAPPLTKPLARKRITPIMRTADRAIRAAEDDATAASAKRRRQVMLLFGGAIAAMAVGTGLAIVASRNSAPPELPVADKTPTGDRLGTPTTVTANEMPRIDAPPPPAILTPAPVPGSQATMLVPGPSAQPPTAPQPAPVQLVPRFPETITLKTLLEKPTAGTGIADYSQTLHLPAGQLDPVAEVTKLQLAFPPANGSAASAGLSEIVFKGDANGSLRATAERREARPAAVITWREPSGASSEVAVIGLNQRAGTVDLAWKTGFLLKQPDIVTLTYWLVQSSTIRLNTQKGSTQQLAFQLYDPAPFVLSGSGGPLTLPAPLPKETVVEAPTKDSLPAGWDGAWYTDWEEKDAALRTSANASQVIKLHKSVGGATDANGQPIEAWFLVKFSPGFAAVENNFHDHLVDAQTQLAQYQSDVRAADAELDRMKRDSGGTLPANNDSVKSMQKKREDAAQTAQAYAAAIAAYNDLKEFDVALSLPNGIRMTTVRFRR